LRSFAPQIFKVENLATEMEEHAAELERSFAKHPPKTALCHRRSTKPPFGGWNLVHSLCC